MTKTIIFDLGGVLLDIDLKHCMQQMQALGIDLSVFEKKEMTIFISTRMLREILGD